MDPSVKKLLKDIGFVFEELEELNGLMIERDWLLDIGKYNEIKEQIPKLKNVFSSSTLTSLQNNANKSQKWPLLNLVRQILGVYGYDMEPIRKSDGYTLEGVKKFKRYFFICKKNV